ncbi:hypothetical protein FSP39_000499 [Pinctada imbricata]|uniref:Uncharacterized protein n=1 Tax=Pinctada imbricata TaxID=66713 RepID=A0AA88YJI4_PINIB|nr:hypothetical protein FSP39_000499 [Pinctada imbricata]
MISYCTIFIVFLLVSVTYQVDLTRQKGSKGSSVVDATLNLIKSKCIFEDDRLFMRRLAYVATNDGNDPKYATDSSGGIWQVPSSAFNKISIKGKLADRKNNITSNFGIDWDNAQYEDLTIPLYSALAAQLFINFLGHEIKADTSTQADYWVDNWLNGIDKINKVNEYNGKVQNMPKPSCSKAVDLVFVMDESGSVGYSNFRKMKYFLSNLTEKMDIGPKAFQVGTVKFNGRARTVFNLTEYHTKSKLQDALKDIRYYGGLTNIGKGIEEAEEIFKQSGSTSRNATRVILLLTDGKSSNATKTRLAAEKARKESNIVIFALGIGNVRESELDDAANKPSCMHKIIIDNFDEIDSIFYQILQVTCGASKKVSLAAESKVDVKVQMKEDVVDDTLEVAPGGDPQTTLQVNVVCAEVDIYESSETTHPNEAFYDSTQKATEAVPAVLQVANNGKKVYVTYKGQKLDNERCKMTKGELHITIQKGASTAPRPVSLQHASKAEISIEVKKENQQNTFEVTPGADPKTTIQVTVTCADVDLSVTTSNTDGTTNNHGDKATDGQPVLITVDNYGSKVHITFTSSVLDRCSMLGGEFKIVIEEGEPKVSVGSSIGIASGSYGSSGAGSGTYSSSSGTGSNIPGSSGGTTSCQGEGKRPLNNNENNPCHPSQSDIFYYPFPNDIHNYIQCDEWGTACVVQCKDGNEWDNDKYACAQPEANSCTTEGEFAVDPGNPSGYKQCINGKWIHRTCPDGLVWNDGIKNCDWPSTSKRQYNIGALLKALRGYEDEGKNDDKYDDE